MEAGIVVDEERSRGGSGCEGGTYVLNIYQVYTYMYIKIMIFAVRGAREEAGTVGDKTKSRRYQWFTYVQRYRYTYMYTYRYVFFLFSLRGAREEAGIAGDEERRSKR